MAHISLSPNGAISSFISSMPSSGQPSVRRLRTDNERDYHHKKRGLHTGIRHASWWRHPGNRKQTWQQKEAANKSLHLNSPMLSAKNSHKRCNSYFEFHHLDGSRGIRAHWWFIHLKSRRGQIKVVVEGKAGGHILYIILINF